MELQEAILTRRSIKNFAPAPVPADALERALSAGRWAQNHHLTQPWRFIVLGAQTQCALAALSAEELLKMLPAGDPARDKVRAGAEQKFLSKPQIVVVTYRLDPDALLRVEDYAATCCAIQIIQLAAWGEGLGMQWSSNRMTRHPASYELFQINPTEEEIVAFLYFGYPASVPAAGPRKPLSDLLRRLP